ncbi:MAG: hypothetical protein JOZ54_02730, partial [Acidobacteria bacterium]|nr:hypothetical protein [Acidobacteriota bacterium]
MILAVVGQLFVCAAAFGILRPWITWPLALIFVLALRPSWKVLVAALPFVALALYPPVAFDEILYHLPFIESLAQTGGFRVLADVRFGIFPQLHEVLCTPLFAAFGDTATHFVALAEVLLLAGVLYEKHGFLAAALCVGSPIVVQLGTVTYVECALMLFIGAAYVCLDEH